MEHHQAEAREHVTVHPLDHVVAHVVVGGVPPPHEHVGLLERRVGEPVLGLVEGRGPDDAAVHEVLLDAPADSRMHTVGVDPGHGLVDLLVAVLPTR